MPSENNIEEQYKSDWGMGIEHEMHMAHSDPKRTKINLTHSGFHGFYETTPTEADNKWDWHVEGDVIEIRNKQWRKQKVETVLGHIKDAERYVHKKVEDIPSGRHKYIFPYGTSGMSTTASGTSIGSYHYTVTLPAKRNMMDEDRYKQRFKWLKAVQWIEPLIMAKMFTGHPHSAGDKGQFAEGSYRMSDGMYANVGGIDVNTFKGHASPDTNRNQGTQIWRDKLNAKVKHTVKSRAQYGIDLRQPDGGTFGIELRFADRFYDPHHKGVSGFMKTMIYLASQTSKHDTEPTNIRASNSRDIWTQATASIMEEGHNTILAKEYVKAVEKNLNIKKGTLYKEENGKPQTSLRASDVFDKLTQYLHNTNKDSDFSKIMIEDNAKKIEMPNTSRNSWNFFFGYKMRNDTAEKAKFKKFAQALQASDRSSSAGKISASFNGVRGMLNHFMGEEYSDEDIRDVLDFMEDRKLVKLTKTKTGYISLVEPVMTDAKIDKAITNKDFFQDAELNAKMESDIGEIGIDVNYVDGSPMVVGNVVLVHEDAHMGGTSYSSVNAFYVIKSINRTNVKLTKLKITRSGLHITRSTKTIPTIEATAKISYNARSIMQLREEITNPETYRLGKLFHRVKSLIKPTVQWEIFHSIITDAYLVHIPSIPFIGDISNIPQLIADNPDISAYPNIKYQEGLGQVLDAEYVLLPIEDNISTVYPSDVLKLAIYQIKSHTANTYTAKRLTIRDESISILSRETKTITSTDKVYKIGTNYIHDYDSWMDSPSNINYIRTTIAPLLKDNIKWEIIRYKEWTIFYIPSIVYFRVYLDAERTKLLKYLSEHPELIKKPFAVSHDGDIITQWDIVTTKETIHTPQSNKMYAMNVVDEIVPGGLMLKRITIDQNGFAVGTPTLRPISSVLAVMENVTEENIRYSVVNTTGTPVSEYYKYAKLKINPTLKWQIVCGKLTEYNIYIPDKYFGTKGDFDTYSTRHRMLLRLSERPRILHTDYITLDGKKLRVGDTLLKYTDEMRYTTLDVSVKSYVIVRIKEITEASITVERYYISKEHMKYIDTEYTTDRITTGEDDLGTIDYALAVDDAGNMTRLKVIVKKIKQLTNNTFWGRFSKEGQFRLFTPAGGFYGSLTEFKTWQRTHTESRREQEPEVEFKDVNDKPIRDGDIVYMPATTTRPIVYNIAQIKYGATGDVEALKYDFTNDTGTSIFRNRFIRTRFKSIARTKLYRSGYRDYRTLSDTMDITRTQIKEKMHRISAIVDVLFLIQFVKPQQTFEIYVTIPSIRFKGRYGDLNSYISQYIVTRDREVAEIDARRARPTPTPTPTPRPTRRTTTTAQRLRIGMTVTIVNVPSFEGQRGIIQQITHAHDQPIIVELRGGACAFARNEVQPVDMKRPIDVKHHTRNVNHHKVPVRYHRRNKVSKGGR